LEVKRLLSIKNIAVHYGKAMALNGVSLEVKEGSVVSIIGANGAGKSTILRSVSGLKKLTSGEIWFDGKRIDGKSITDIVKMGLVHIPEGRKLFPYLTVISNLKLGASLRSNRLEIEKDLQAVFERFPILYERRNQEAGTMSGGEQQMLAIGRGLMAKPRLLMLDEPSLGLAPIMVENVGKIVKDIQKQGVTILLVEQNISLALGVAQKGYAMQVGKVVMEGDVEKFRSADAIKQAYLGG
jgi:branched-chain amino acid transport system ATP-binding protein